MCVCAWCRFFGSAICEEGMGSSVHLPKILSPKKRDVVPPIGVRKQRNCGQEGTDWLQTLEAAGLCCDCLHSRGSRGRSCEWIQRLPHGPIRNSRDSRSGEPGISFVRAQCGVWF